MSLIENVHMSDNGHSVCRNRYRRLHSMMSSMQEQQRQEELEERQQTSTWGYHLRQCSRYAGCVALGAGGILALIHVCEGREGLRALRL